MNKGQVVWTLCWIYGFACVLTYLYGFPEVARVSMIIGLVAGLIFVLIVLFLFVWSCLEES